jgi:hypothetical protein
LTNIKQEIISTIYINDQAFEQRAFNQLTFLDGKMVSIQPISANKNTYIEDNKKNNQTANCAKPNTDGLTIKQLLDLMLDDTICG